MMIIDVWELAKTAAAVFAVGVVALSACCLNDLWLQWILTSEQYDTMIDSYDDWS